MSDIVGLSTLRVGVVIDYRSFVSVKYCGTGEFLLTLTKEILRRKWSIVLKTRQRKQGDIQVFRQTPHVERIGCGEEQFSPYGSGEDICLYGHYLARSRSDFVQVKMQTK